MKFVAVTIEKDMETAEVLREFQKRRLRPADDKKLAALIKKKGWWNTVEGDLPDGSITALKGARPNEDGELCVASAAVYAQYSDKKKKAIEWWPTTGKWCAYDSFLGVRK